MNKSKGQETRLSIESFKQLLRSNSVYLTEASIEEDPVVYHVYICDGVTTRLLYSCSEFRNELQGLRQSIGRANSYLTWRDFCFFKQIGVSNYDWGGISSFELPNGIDEYKMKFGGERVKYFEGMIPLSLKAKMIEKVQKIKKSNVVNYAIKK